MILRRPFFWLILATVAVFVLLPLRGNNVGLRESLLLAAVAIILAGSVNLMIGYAGYVNFGNIVFYGLGGYFGIFFSTKLGWRIVPAALTAGVAVSIFALIFGSAILRLRGAYFALATIGINQAVKAFVTNFRPCGRAEGIYLEFTAYQPLGGPMRALLRSMRPEAGIAGTAATGQGLRLRWLG